MNTNSSSSKTDWSGYRDAFQRVSSHDTSWEEKLFRAITQGDVRTVKILMRKGVDVNATHPSGRTPLGTAAHLGNVEILKILLEPHAESKAGDCLNFGRKCRESKKEIESSYEGACTKGRSSSSSPIDNQMKINSNIHDVQSLKIAFRPNLRKDSLSSDDDLFDETDTNLRHPQRHSKRANDQMNADQSEKVDEDVERELCHQSPCSHLHCPTHSLPLLSSNKLEANQGYFIVVHNDHSPEEKNSEDESARNVCDENFTEPITPDGMDNLEWDSEVQLQVSESPQDDKESSDSWIGLYRWYADYLAKSCAVDMSVQHSTSLGIDVNQLDMYRRSAMHYAAEQGNVDVLRILLSAGCLVDVGDSDDVTPLHLAAARDNPEAVALLISCGAKVNRKSIDGTGPLHMAAARGFMETASILLEHGASVNALDRSDRTPLLLAVSRGLDDMVKLLISHGAKVNVEDILGYTPLCQAVWQQEKEIVRLLLASGAKLTHSDRLLHCAILHRCPDIAELLISAGSIVNLRDDSGDTPLIIASRSGQVDVVNLLLQNGAMASYPNGLTGSTPLHEAVECLRPAHFAVLKEILLSLLSHRGPTGLLNIESSSAYDTPLVRALIHDRDHAMILLIQYGADVNILQQHTPIVSEEYLLKRPNRWVIAQLMVFAGLNLWHYCNNVKYDVRFSEDSPSSWISSMKFNPMSLCGLSRLKFRLYHGENLYKAVLRSGLPGRLRKYIMLEDIINVDDFVRSSK